MDAVITGLLAQSGIKERPNAHSGVWLMFLLPCCIIWCSVKHLQETSQLYRLCSAMSVGIIGTSAIFVVQCTRKKPLTITRTLHLIPAAFTATVFRIWLHSGLFFSLISGLISSVFYWKMLLTVFRMFPLSFSLGEVSVTVQALILFLYCTAVNILNTAIETPTTIIGISTITIQVGLSAIGLVCLLTYHFKELRNPLWFYTVSGVIMFLFIEVLLHLLLQQEPLLWVVTFLLEDLNRAKMVMYCVACSIAAAAAVNRQIRGAKKATPAVRKIFHIFAVAVFLPGLICQCSFIFLASGVVLGVFAVLELLRVLDVPPLGNYLENGFLMYRDEKDTGTVALTPMYLLVGCSLPLWLHPSPCDVLDSAGFNLLPVMSGVLAIGVGDTLASVVGTTYGKHKWPGTKKTIEGTIGCIVSQFALVWALIYTGYVSTNGYEIIRVLFAIVVGSLVEAKTTQIDNIALPLILFIILC